MNAIKSSDNHQYLPARLLLARLVEMISRDVASRYCAGTYGASASSPRQAALKLALWRRHAAK